MPLVLLIIGAIFVVAGIKNNGAILTQTIADDFSGAGSFWYWIIAIIAVGSIGYYQPAKHVSHLFLFLIVLVFVLSNGGVYQQFTQAISNPVPAAPNSGAGGATGVVANDPTSDKLATASGLPTGATKTVTDWARETNPILGIAHMLGYN